MKGLCGRHGKPDIYRFTSYRLEALSSYHWYYRNNIYFFMKRLYWCCDVTHDAFRRGVHSPADDLQTIHLSVFTCGKPCHLVCPRARLKTAGISARRSSADEYFHCRKACDSFLLDYLSEIIAPHQLRPSVRPSVKILEKRFLQKHHADSNENRYQAAVQWAFDRLCRLIRFSRAVGDNLLTNLALFFRNVLVKTTWPNALKLVISGLSENVQTSGNSLTSQHWTKFGQRHRGKKGFWGGVLNLDPPVRKGA